MTLTLAEVVALDVVQRTGPQVVVGAELLNRPVRWVHTSELAEAPYLLKGGELLLTTGLGISGRGPLGEAAYVTALAERGAAGLALELGWTYQQAPSALVAACREHGVPLVVLQKVFPFVEITEQVQSAILERAMARLRRERDVREVLTDALLAGAGPQELTEVLADLVCARVVVTTAEGAQVASAGGDPGASGRRGRPVARRDVVLLDRHWGYVAVLPPACPDDPVVAAACSYGAEAVGLALLRSAAGADLNVRRRQLLEDVAERRWRVPGELVARARVLGLPFPAVGRYVALLATDLGTVDGDAVAAAVNRELALGTSLVADVGGDVLAVVHTTEPNAVATSMLRAVDSAGAAGGRVVVGTVVGRLEEVDGSIRRARAAREVPAGDGRITLAAELTPQLLLSGIQEEPLAVELVAEQLGPLLDHDRATGGDLVQTLRVYLACSSSKVAAAQALRVRRQTLYGRLQRIEQLIGPVSSPRRHTALVLALALHELAGTGGRLVPGTGSVARRRRTP